MTIAQAREEWISPQTKVVTTNDTEKNIGDLQPGEKNEGVSSCQQQS